MDAAGRGIEARLDDILRDKFLFEAVHRIAAPGIGLVVAGDPLGRPVALLQQPQLEAAFAGFARLALFIPDLHAPGNSIPAAEHLSPIGDVGHGRALHLAAVPDGLAPAGADDPIGGLRDSILRVPVKPGLRIAEAKRLSQIFDL